MDNDVAVTVPRIGAVELGFLAILTKKLHVLCEADRSQRGRCHEGGDGGKSFERSHYMVLLL